MQKFQWLIASDLDGTLLLPDGRLGTFTLDVLKQLPEEVLFVPVTGRLLQRLPFALLQLPRLPYVLCCNGASVWSPRVQEALFCEAMEKEELLMLLPRLRTQVPYLEVYVGGYAYTDQAFLTHFDERWYPENKRKDMARGKIVVHELKDLIAAHFVEVEKLFLPHAPHLQEDLAEYSKRFPGLEFCSSGGQSVEINRKGVNKAKGLTRLIQMLGMQKDQVMVFGDQGNDLELLAEFPRSAAVANASEAAKAVASEVIGSCAEEGVARFLKERILRESYYG